MALPIPEHNHVLTPPLPKSGLAHLHLPQVWEAHLPEKLTHSQERRSSVQAFETELEKDIETHQRDGKAVDGKEVEGLKQELHELEGMTEREKEKWVAFKQSGQTDGERRRSVATGYEGGVVFI